MKRLRAMWLLGPVLAGGSILVACHLFLDPDELTSGRGGDAGDAGNVIAPGDGGTTGDGGDAIISLDGSVPSCLPPLPLGVTPVAAVGGTPSIPTACPTGYVAAGATGYSNIIGTDFTCDYGGCTCGAPNANSFSCDNVKLVYASDPACTTKTGSQNYGNFGFGCPKVGGGGSSGGMYAESAGTFAFRGGGPSNNACPATGTANITKSDAKASLSVQVCRPTNTNATECPGNDQSMAAIGGAVACYVSQSGNCDPGYGQQITAPLSPDLNDTRACTCGCTVDPDGGTCVGGTVTVANGSCQKTTDAGIVATCQPVANYGTNYLDLDREPTPDVTNVHCTPTGNKSGNVTFKGGDSVTLCCLTECQSCRQIAVSPNGLCAAVTKACSDSPACRAFYACAEKNHCGDNCGPTCFDGGVTDPDVDSKYRTIRACLAGACPTPTCTGKE
jgi:hypothetical protein